MVKLLLQLPGLDPVPREPIHTCLPVRIHFKMLPGEQP